MLVAVTMRLREAWRCERVVEAIETPVEVGERERRECFTEIEIWEAKMKRKVSTWIASMDW